MLGVVLVALRGLLLNSTPVLRILPCVVPKLSPCVATQLGNKVVGCALPADVWQSGGAWVWAIVICFVWQLGQVCVLLGKCRALSGKGRDLFGWNCVLLGRGAVFAGFFSVGGGVGRSFCKTVAQIGWGNFANHLEFCIAVWYNDRERRWLFAKRHPLRGHC